MTIREYAADPCRASALPYWKTEGLTVPPRLSVVRDDAYAPERYPGTDEPYFKLIHELREVPSPILPAGFRLRQAEPEDYARHIGTCYREIGVTAEELRGYQARPVFDPALWIAVAEEGTGTIVATGIGERDRRLGEGTLEWIQVSPGYRRRGLGRYLVCELLRRLQKRARFVTVSGKLREETQPLLLYRACGFADPVIWHVVRRAEETSG